MEVLESDLRDLQCSLSEKTMCVRPHCFLVISADWSHRSQLLGCDGCACRLCGGMCVYILFRKFLSLFRHSLRIGYWQEVCCEVLQAVSVGIVKNLFLAIYIPPCVAVCLANFGADIGTFQKIKYQKERKDIV